MQLCFYKNDLPNDFPSISSIAIDTETMGLYPHRDRLCLVQLSTGDGVCYLVQISPENQSSPNLEKILKDDSIQKIFHFGRFDIRVLYHRFGILPQNVYCTKIASRLVRTYTDRHSLKDLCRELLSVDIAKQEQTSDWGADILSPEQQKYAATDVLHLHALKRKLDFMLNRESRASLAQACFDFLPHRVLLDLMTEEDFDIFKH